MLKKALIHTVLLVCLIMPAFAFGQETPVGRWWRLPQIAEKLNLTNEQRRQLDELFFTNRRKLIEMKSILERERLELDSVFNREPIDEEGIMAHFRRLEAARHRLATERFKYLIAVRKIVGIDRFQRLEMIFRGFRGVRPRAMEPLDPN